MPRHKVKLRCDALFRAAYYRWNVHKGFALGGNDPIDGHPRKRGVYGDLALEMVEEAAVAYKAMARYWLSRARALRQGAPC